MLKLMWMSRGLSTISIKLKIFKKKDLMTDFVPSRMVIDQKQYINRFD